MSGKKQYKSAYERLRHLPPVVHLSELGLDEQYVRSGVRRWRKKGYLAPVGRKTGVYFNLVADERAPTLYREDAALKAMMGGRRSVRPYVTGEAALQVAGCLRGATHLIDVTVLANASIGVSEEEMGDLRIHPRPDAWYDWVEKVTRRRRQLAIYGLSGAPVLPPDLVLADQQVFQDYPIDHSRVVKVASSRVDRARRLLEESLGIVPMETMEQRYGGGPEI